MPHTHNALLFGQLGFDVGADILNEADLVEHLHHFFVGTTVQCARQSTDRRRNCGVGIGQGGGGNEG